MNNSFFITNCKYYYQLTANVIACSRCDFGYTGVIEGTTNIGYMRSCTLMTGCDTSVRYQSISLGITIGSLDRHFSCHACTTGALVSAVDMSGNNTTTLLVSNIFPATAYILDNTGIAAELTPNGYIAGTSTDTPKEHNVCLDFTSLASFSTDPTITGCAMYFLDVANAWDASGFNTDTAADTALGITCAACLPGYTPLYHATYLETIIDCQAGTTTTIPANMNTLNTVIGTLNYDINTDTVETTVEGPTGLTNCLAGSNFDNKCRVCNKGYSLTPAKDCVLDTNALCLGWAMYRSSSALILNFTDAAHIYNLEPASNSAWALFYRQYKGCTRCPADFVLQREDSPSHVRYCTNQQPSDMPALPNCKDITYSTFFFAY